MLIDFLNHEIQLTTTNVEPTGTHNIRYDGYRCGNASNWISDDNSKVYTITSYTRQDGDDHNWSSVRRGWRGTAAVDDRQSPVFTNNRFNILSPETVDTRGAVGGAHECFDQSVSFRTSDPGHGVRETTVGCPAARFQEYTCHCRSVNVPARGKPLNQHVRNRCDLDEGRWTQGGTRHMNSAATIASSSQQGGKHIGVLNIQNVSVQ